MPGNSGWTVPVFHRTSLGHRPYVAGDTTPAGSTRPLLDLLGELFDHLGHRLLHPGQLPVLDLDQADRRGRGDGRRALLLLEQALLAEHVAGTEVGEVLA